MRQMKNSEIEWVGEIPAEWEAHPIYYYFGERKHKNSLGKEGNLLSLSYGKVIRKDITSSDGLLPENYNGYNIVEKNDIVLRLTDLQNDKRSLRTGLVKERGILTSAYVTLRPIKEEFSPFFHYVLHAYDVMKVFYNMGNGVRQGLNFDELSKCMLIAPPLSEQKAIAEFLDKKCGEVDALIADIQQEIETLEQYKRSVITEAVTKGLDPSVPMIDSGIDYLGRINSEWRLTKLGYICQKLNRPVPEKAEALICSNKGKVVLREDVSVGLISENDRMYQGVKVGDLCIHGMDTWHGAIAVSSLNGKITTVVHCCDSREDKRFIAYYLQMLAFKKVYKAISNGVRGNTSDFRSWDKAGDIYIVLPNRETQQQIADYLDKKCKEIEGVIADKQSQIETLESYKKSLIYEYVTGKKEIIAQ